MALLLQSLDYFSKTVHQTDSLLTFTRRRMDCSRAIVLAVANILFVLVFVVLETAGMYEWQICEIFQIVAINNTVRKIIAVTWITFYHISVPCTTKQRQVKITHNTEQDNFWWWNGDVAIPLGGVAKLRI